MTSRWFGRATAAIGLFLVFVPVVYYVNCIYMFTDQWGRANPSADEIITPMLSFAKSYLASFAGMLLMGLYFDGHSPVSRSIVLCFRALGILHIFLFPIGTIFGIGMVVYTFQEKLANLSR